MSKTRLLALLVEGNDDDRFVRTVVAPGLHPAFDSVFPWKYAEEPPDRVDSFVESIESAGGSYLLFVDEDGAPCVASRKEELMERYPSLSAERIVVVCAEIESWYYAGLPKKRPQCLKSCQRQNTDALSKEELKTLKPPGVRSRVDFLIELLRAFSYDDARERNSSFDYLCRKHDVLKA